MLFRQRGTSSLGCGDSSCGWRQGRVPRAGIRVGQKLLSGMFAPSGGLAPTELSSHEPDFAALLERIAWGLRHRPGVKTARHPCQVTALEPQGQRSTLAIIISRPSQLTAALAGAALPSPGSHSPLIFGLAAPHAEELWHA